MRCFIRSILILTSLLLMFGTANAVDIGQIIQEINPEKTTKDSRLDYWKDMAGKEVAWTGRFYKARGGFRGIYKVFVKVGKPEIGNYNVIITVANDPQVASLKKGTVIRFKGKLHKYKWTKPKPVKKRNGSMEYVRQFVIYLDDAHIFPGRGR